MFHGGCEAPLLDWSPSESFCSIMCFDKYKNSAAGAATSTLCWAFHPTLPRNEVRSAVPTPCASCDVRYSAFLVPMLTSDADWRACNPANPMACPMAGAHAGIELFKRNMMMTTGHLRKHSVRGGE